MVLAESAVRVWRAHHNGSLAFEARIDGSSLMLPWTGRRIEVTNNLEEMRGRLREVGFNEDAVEKLMAWLFGETVPAGRQVIATEAAVALPELVESLV